MKYFPPLGQDGVNLQPRPHSCMRFASDNDNDDIYDSEHRLKEPADLA